MIKFKRLEDWPERLLAFIDDQQTRLPAWGVSDCAIFAMNAVSVMVGVDPIPECRKHKNGPATYTTERGAWLALKHRDGTLRRAMTKRFGTPVRWQHARRGDVVMITVPHKFKHSLGICLGAVSIFADPGEGFIQIKTNRAVCAWRVGD